MLDGSDETHLAVQLDFGANCNHYNCGQTQRSKWKYCVVEEVVVLLQ